METIAIAAGTLVHVGEPFRSQESLIFWVAVTVAVVFLCILPHPTYRSRANVPTVKFISPLLPKFISRLLFNSSAATVIYKGYDQVCGHKLTGDKFAR
jgi:hypothetical protein